MAAPLASQSKGCTEGLIKLPPNDAATCWWISSNLALFHKQRKELDDFFSKSVALQPIDEVIPDSVKGILQKMYNHYLNTAPVDPAEIIKDRENPEMAQFFDEPGVFEVDSGDFQDATEYLMKFVLRILQPFEVQPEEGSKVPLALWDLDCVQRFEGLNTKANIRSYSKKTQISAKTQTLTVWIKRNIIADYKNPGGDPKGVDESKTGYFEPVLLPEILTIPLSKYDKNIYESTLNLSKESVKGEFKLDAILCGRRGHYWAVVNCTGTEEWFWFSGNTVGQLSDKDKYPSFKALVEKYKDDKAWDIPSHAIVCFYTRIGGDPSVATEVPPIVEISGVESENTVKSLQSHIQDEITFLEGVYVKPAAKDSPPRLDLGKAKAELTKMGEGADVLINKALDQPATRHLVTLKQIVSSYANAERREINLGKSLQEFYTTSDDKLASLKAIPTLGEEQKKQLEKLTTARATIQADIEKQSPALNLDTFHIHELRANEKKDLQTIGNQVLDLLTKLDNLEVESKPSS